MKSASSVSGSGTNGVPKAFLTARQGGNRQFRWTTTGKVPGDRSARGALDGSSYSSKDNTFTTTVLSDTVKIGQQSQPPSYNVYKAFLSFDTSGIPQDATNISAKLVFYGKRKVLTGTPSPDFSIHVFKSVYEEPLWNSDWEATTGAPFEDAAKYASDANVPVNPNASQEEVALNSELCRNEIAISDASLLITKGGITKLALVSSNTYAGSAPSADEYIEIYSPNAVKELRPRLEISYDGSAMEIKPVLRWLAGDAYFKDTGAYPDQIYTGATSVTFRVRYFSADANGDSGPAPEVHQVLIDINSDGDYDDPGEQVDMEALPDPGDDYSDGRDYGATVTLVGNGKNIKYQFLFKSDADSTVEAGGSPATAQVITAIQAEKKSKSDSKSCFISSL
ncbi:MAG: hypothetical protein AB1611_00405 [bacterium]